MYEIQRKQLFLLNQHGNIYIPNFRYLIKYDWGEGEQVNIKFTFNCPLQILLIESEASLYEHYILCSNHNDS